MILSLTFYKIEENMSGTGFQPISAIHAERAPSYGFFDGKPVQQLTEEGKEVRYGIIANDNPNSRVFRILKEEELPSIFGRAFNRIAYCFELIGDLFKRCCCCSRDVSEEISEVTNDAASKAGDQSGENDIREVDDELDTPTDSEDILDDVRKDLPPKDSVPVETNSLGTDAKDSSSPLPDEDVEGIAEVPGGSLPEKIEPKVPATSAQPGIIIDHK